MKRQEYNNSLLKEALDLIKSSSADDVFKGMIQTAYITEQAFKYELKRLNPLFYYDIGNTNSKLQVDAALDRLSSQEILSTRTSPAKRCVDLISEYNKKIREHSEVFYDLFSKRNFLVHSINDIPFDGQSAAEVAATSLKFAEKYITKYISRSKDKLNPLTSKDFKKLQEEKERDVLEQLRVKLLEHNSLFLKLDPDSISQRLEERPSFLDNQTWLQSTSECPACGINSLDEIGSVDFDGSSDSEGFSASSGTSYLCRVCELDITEHEYKLIIWHDLDQTSHPRH